MQEIESVVIEPAFDLIFITVAKYEMFLSMGAEGRDAKDLYEHLMYTARRQGTNQVKAKDIYLKKGLNWGSERLRKAKNLLKELGLMEVVQERDEKGHFKNGYIKVKAATLETVTRPDRERVPDNKCFNKKDKCLNNKITSIVDHWNLKNKLQTHKKSTVFDYLKKKHKTILNDETEQRIKQTIDLYYQVITDKEYFFSYRWTLWDFIGRGYYKFTPEAMPLTNFLRDKNAQGTVGIGEGIEEKVRRWAQIEEGLDI